MILIERESISNYTLKTLWFHEGEHYTLVSMDTAFHDLQSLQSNNNNTINIPSSRVSLFHSNYIRVALFQRRLPSPSSQSIVTKSSAADQNQSSFVEQLVSGDENIILSHYDYSYVLDIITSNNDKLQLEVCYDTIH
jgi:hypothetical protein